MKICQRLKGEFLQMVKLFIDTSSREEIILKINEKKFTLATIQNKSQKLLSFIHEVLNKEQLKLTDISEIEVALGPGSFTGLRVGVSVANTLGYTLGVKVNGLDITEGEQVKINY